MSSRKYIFLGLRLKILIIIIIIINYIHQKHFKFILKKKNHMIVHL